MNSGSLSTACCNKLIWLFGMSELRGGGCSMLKQCGHSGISHFHYSAAPQPGAHCPPFPSPNHMSCFISFKQRSLKCSSCWVTLQPSWAMYVPSEQHLRGHPETLLVAGLARAELHVWEDHTCVFSNLPGHRAQYQKHWPGPLLALDPGSPSLPCAFLQASL